MSCHEPVKVRGGFVACAFCPGCRARRSATWAVRLEDELKQWDRSCFLTLTIANEYKNETFRDEDVPSPVRVRKRDLQLFFKRLRFLGPKVKYFAVGEYGEVSARAHYHVILFGVDVRDRVSIETAWPFGVVDIGRVEPASIRYVTGYVMKAPLGRLRLHAERSGQYPPFCLPSIGIGKVSAKRRRHTIVTQGVIRIGAVAVAPPRTYVSWLSRGDRVKFKLARRNFLLARAQEDLAEGRPYVVNNVVERAVVGKADFRARQKPRGTL